jgi:diguanylate cyclase (GGDEF)-like protein
MDTGFGQMDDIRYSELQFLRALANRSIELFNYNDEKQKKIAANIPTMYSEMLVTLVEDSYVRFEKQNCQLLVARLRGELAQNYPKPRDYHQHQWDDPRATLDYILQVELQPIRITYRGLRRIEELRDLLSRDRILEPFGVLLDLRYFRRDLEGALQRGSDTPVSVIYADMDYFGIINKKFGQAAGDVVMKAYLETVQKNLGAFGEGYRGRGDEVAALVIGQGHQRTVELAEAIRKGVESLRCEYKNDVLPPVAVSIGVATTPPEQRTLDLETLAESRKRQAKENGRNRVVAS